VESSVDIEGLICQKYIYLFSVLPSMYLFSVCLFIYLVEFLCTICGTVHWLSPNWALPSSGIWRYVDM